MARVSVHYIEKIKDAIGERMDEMLDEWNEEIVAGRKHVSDYFRPSMEWPDLDLVNESVKGGDVRLRNIVKITFK